MAFFPTLVVLLSVAAPLLIISHSYGYSCNSTDTCGGVGPLEFPFAAVGSNCGSVFFQVDCSRPAWLNMVGNYASALPLRRITPQNRTFVVDPDPTMSNCTHHQVASFSNLIRNIYALTSNNHTTVVSSYTILAYGCNATMGNVSSFPPSLTQGSDLCASFSNSCLGGSDPMGCFQTRSLDGNATFNFKIYNCQYFTSFYGIASSPSPSPSPSPLPSPSSSVVSPLSVDIEHLGLQIEWNNMEDVVSVCKQCTESGGSCGYNETVSFLCYCGDQAFMSPSCAPPEVSDHSAGTMRLKLAAASSAGAGLVLGLLLVLVVILVRRRRRKAMGQSGFRGIHSSNSSKEMMQALADQVGPLPTKLFSYQELLKATKSFSETRVLGDGGFGMVYEGRLSDGRKVAVKRLYHDDSQRLKQFVNEIRILSSLEHPNLIKLYGFCYESHRDLLLVYELACNGTVADHLHADERLPWESRLRIAIETAQALEYLHSYVNPPIFHRDVKSSNILLHDNMQVKLADFGLSWLVPPQSTHISTAPQGTPGYLDPDYHQSYQLTDKSDVYSFGVVLMELISGKLPVDMSRNKGDINLSSFAIAKIQTDALDELIDPHLRVEIERKIGTKEMVSSLAALGVRCLASDKEDRPSMKEVVAELFRIQNLGSGCCRNNVSPFASPQPSPTVL